MGHATPRTPYWLAAALVMGLATPALADYPEKPITLIVPWAAGGGTDATARIIAKALEEELGETINVVNRTGGSGVVGHTAIARAKPDGYTLGLGTVEINMMHWQGLTDLTYEDFTPIGQINFDAASISVAEDADYQDLGELMEAIRDQPDGHFNASGTGLGGIWHVALGGLLMDLDMSADKVNWIPSQGAAPAMTELASGGVDMAATSLPEARSMIESGRVRSLGVMAEEPLESFPDVPTVTSQVDSDFTTGAWRGVIGPQGMDDDIVETLETALHAAYESDTYQTFMAKQGYGVQWKDAQAFGDYMETSDAEFGEIMKAIGLAKQ
ncbi:MULTISPECIES: tripartite tricarboxylate transporter substrate binding protein [Chromohalobacter]|uniref:Tripartite tricarboxylate transporter substrate binding protein n=1 Tax=Chromohalobacter beijerinckii TaxID=86179 RepID=A0ABV8XEI3_9GAMM|nr:MULTISPECIES: tripartite tricarboxylate transporter substrate binding protein [Chromohalobacter]MCK0751919.1 tripartite tricarboxylate transporter substrate binding protein [Chromohalobacter japonicus]MCK0765261.1 tripartite tricarboxylate transporter substrate binding protein [Chromohalobacter beijerinckii]